MGIIDGDFREILSSQMVSVAGGIAAGTVLAVFTDNILLIPGMLILIPGFLEMRGNISGTFASRLSAGLFLGVVDPRRKNTRITRGNMAASFLLAVLVSFALGLLALAFNFFMLHQLTPEILLLPVIAGLIANAIEIPLTLFTTLFLFRKGHDPNNIMGPFVTSTGDITSIVSLLVAMVLI